MTSSCPSRLGISFQVNVSIHDRGFENISLDSSPHRLEIAPNFSQPGKYVLLIIRAWLVLINAPPKSPLHNDAHFRAKFKPPNTSSVHFCAYQTSPTPRSSKIFVYGRRKGHGVRSDFVSPPRLHRPLDTSFPSSRAHCNPAVVMISKESFPPIKRSLIRTYDNYPFMVRSAPRT